MLFLLKSQEKFQYLNDDSENYARNTTLWVAVEVQKQCIVVKHTCYICTSTIETRQQKSMTKFITNFIFNAKR